MFLFEQPVILSSCVFILGLIVGSFLNVVIYRLPIMMQRNWRGECLEFLQLDPSAVGSVAGFPNEADYTIGDTFNLLFPLSRCSKCLNPVKPYHNIPVLSFLLLKGKCAYCGGPISIRYPLIELFSGIASALVAWRFGYSLETVFALLLTWSLISLSFIDIDYQLLPDSINLPMLWLGLLLSLFGFFTDSHSSIIGAIAGYGSLWLVYHLFKLVTGKEGMGFGDFKLLAVFGAWLGWQYIPMIVLLSSLVGALIGIAMVILTKRDQSIPIPFGPYLAAAGWLALLWGEAINRYYLTLSGF